MPSGNGYVPSGAVSVGREPHGEPLFVGRARFQDSLTPGKVNRAHRCLYLPYGGTEHAVRHYEVLVRKCDSAC